MLSSSKMTRYMALASIIVSTSVRAEFPVDNLTAVGGVTFALIGGKWVEKVPGFKTVNETVSQVPGIEKENLETAESIAFVLGGATLTGQVESKTAKKCALGGAEMFTAQAVLNLQRDYLEDSAFVPKKGSKAEYLEWLALQQSIHYARDPQNAREAQAYALMGLEAFGAHEAMKYIRKFETVEEYIPKGSLREKVVLEVLRSALHMFVSQTKQP